MKRLLGLCFAVVVTVPAVHAEEDLVVTRSRVTGLATAVELRDGGPLPMAPADVTDDSPGVDFLKRHGRVFGIRDLRTQLRVGRSFVDLLDQRHTTYQQLHRGVPVFAAALKIHQGRDGGVLAANGHFFPVPDELSVTPTLAQEEAAVVALTRARGMDLRVVRSELVIVDPGWYGDPPRGPRLAWQFSLAGADGMGAEGLFVDAHSAEILDRWPMLRRDRHRVIHDGQGLADLPGALARSEGWPPANPPGDPVAHDINAAYDYAGDVYAFQANAFGRDSLDDEGIEMVATVNSTAIESLGTPCPSAFFSTLRRQAVFCLGRVPDDVVAHELQHGLTEFASGLFYQNQGAMLSESFSFVFGETVDLFNSGSEMADASSGPPSASDYGSDHGIDTPNRRRSRCSPPPNYPDGVRWLYNEDRREYEGATYDYWDPTCFGHPDRAMSPLFDCSAPPHLGAAVPNHAFAMVVDGQTFNGVTVEGIGLFKAAAVWYRALTVYLTPGSDFEDANWALNRAAADLVGSFPRNPRNGEAMTESFTVHDANQVALALHAVEMDQPARCGWARQVLDSTPPVSCNEPVPVFEEGFDGGLGDWTVTNSSPAFPSDWRVTDPGEGLPLARPGRAAFAADPTNSPCVPPGDSGTSTLTSPTIELPAELDFPVLELTHFVSTEWGWDGGMIELRVGHGQWLPLSPEYFFFNPYNLTLVSETRGNTNPLAGRPAFSGFGGAWGSSLAHLGALVTGGESLQLRLVLGRDTCVGAGGWYVDTIRVFDCRGSEDCNTNNTPDEVETAGGLRKDVILVRPSSHDTGYPSDAEPSTGAVSVQAQRLALLVPKTVQTLRVWGHYNSADSSVLDDFTVVLHEEDPTNGLPGGAISTQSSLRSTRDRTDLTAGQGFDEWRFTIHLDEPVTLTAGTYWIELFNRTADDEATFSWSTSQPTPGGEIGAATAGQAPGLFWQAAGAFDMAIEVAAEFVGADCDRNRVPDSCDIVAGRLSDEDQDGAADRCEPRRAQGRIGR